MSIVNLCVKLFHRINRFLVVSYADHPVKIRILLFPVTNHNFLQTYNVPCDLCGDFNNNLLNDETHNLMQSFLDLLFSFAFHIYIISIN